jgi:hypothetical protein
MLKTNNSYFLKDSNHTLHSSKSDLQEDSTSSDNLVKIPQEELDDIILSLEFTITDINQDQNKYYVIEELENIINKLKNYYIKFKQVTNLNRQISKKEFIKSNSTNIPIIKLPNNYRLKKSYSPLKPHINNSHQVINSYNSLNGANNLTSIIKMNMSNSSKNLKANNFVQSSYNSNTTKVPIRNGRSPKETRYNGPRVNGKKEGKGIYIYPNGCRYEGYFKNDKKEGLGIFYYTNGDRYEGQFEDGNYEGNGIFYFSNGDRYEGQFEKNKYSGKGKYYYHTGDWFDGFWMDDKKNGEGTYNYKNGDRIVGKHQNGKPIETHIKYCKDGKTLQINY